jgi:hypothetical protein
MRCLRGTKFENHWLNRLETTSQFHEIGYKNHSKSNISEEQFMLVKVKQGKAVPQHTYGGAGGRGGIAPTHSQPRH